MISRPPLLDQSTALDRLTGGKGDDTLTGGRGNDRDRPCRPPRPAQAWREGQAALGASADVGCN
jgi:hypothetical protein